MIKKNLSNNTSDDDKTVRIAKYIARAGVCSRRQAEAMIFEGRVKLNGEIISTPAITVTDKDKIIIDNKPLPKPEPSRVWLYHKPSGLVVSNKDDKGRSTIFTNLPEDIPRVVSIGRLDINTEGLLLLTNDGELARMLELPETGWLKLYRVRAFGKPDSEQLASLKKGITVDGIHYGSINAEIDKIQKDNCWLTVGLREGKNREVKKVLEHFGLKVNRLIRISFGPFQLGTLTKGQVKEVRRRTLKDQIKGFK